MGIYARGNKLWCTFKDGTGKWVCKSTGLKVGQEGKALQALAKIEGQVREYGTAARHEVTFSEYLETWLKQRRARGVWTVDKDEQRLSDYVVPAIGRKKLAAITTKDLRTVFAELAGKYAPRTVRNTYGALHRLFADAVADELLDTTPCNLGRRDLPGRVDQDRTWRAGAVFSRDEAAALLGDEVVPLRARVLYGLALLGGLREGEISALRWRDLEKREPLDCLHVHSSYSRANGEVKSTKTGRARTVPVHPELAKLLATWKLATKPEVTDLVLPAASGGHVTDCSALSWLARDLAALGNLRHRRFHDMRRTFISLAIADGARADVLHWITHGPKGDIIDQYTTLPYPALAEAVSALKLKPKKHGGEVLRLAAGAHYNPHYSPASEPQRSREEKRTSLGRRGLEVSRAADTRGHTEGGADTALTEIGTSGHDRPDHRSGSLQWAAEAREVLNAFERSGDTNALERGLAHVLRCLRSARSMPPAR